MENGEWRMANDNKKIAENFPKEKQGLRLHAQQILFLKEIVFVRTILNDSESKIKTKFGLLTNR
ncbi:hypothetical protein BGP_6509 [Beggiatoa sp. PS]|nr:hypothetical protein BGP_6509 [Beggiatoa sp. PS]